MSIEVRRATAEDAEAVREIVLRALREVNARDYPASVIDRLAAILPERIAATLGQTQTYVATDAGRVVGTARLNGRTITSVFVDPDDMARGVGAKLLDAIENAARENSERLWSYSPPSPHLSFIGSAASPSFERSCSERKRSSS